MNISHVDSSLRSRQCHREYHVDLVFLHCRISSGTIQLISLTKQSKIKIAGENTTTLIYTVRSK